MKKILGLGPLFIVIAASLWALDGVLRISLYSLPPATIVFYEHLFGFVILSFIFFKWIKDLKKMTRKEWIGIAIVSLFSGALGTIFYTLALQKVNFISYSVVVLLQQQLQPIWAILAASLLLKEKVSKKFLFWTVIALISVYFVTFKDLTFNLQTGQGALIAALLALGAGFMWGSSTAVSKLVLKKVSFLTATAERFFLAPIFALGFVILQNQTSSLFALNTQQITTLIVIALSTGMVSLVIYYYGLKKTSARVSAICEMAFPITAVLIDYFYFHKTLSPTQIMGIFFLIFAVFKVSQQNKKA